MNGNRHRELSEFDWLLQKIEILATARRLIFVTFLMMSAFGCAAVYAMARPVYSSNMVLPLSSRLQALIQTDIILSAVEKDLRLQASDPATLRESQNLASRLTVSELKKGSDLFLFTAAGDSPQKAKALLDQVFIQLAAASKPTGSALTNVQNQIESLARALSELKDLSAVLKENAQRTKGGIESELYARSFVILVSDMATKEQKIQELQNFLEGIKIQDVIVSPSLSSQPTFPGFRRRLAAVLLFSLLLPVSFVFLRDMKRRRNNSYSAPADSKVADQGNP